MPAIVLNGKSLAERIEAQLRERVDHVKRNNGGQTPILATILVGTDPSSATYVKMKGNACHRVGMEPLKIELRQQTTTQELLTEIRRLNDNPAVYGILLQHPVP